MDMESLAAKLEYEDRIDPETGELIVFAPEEQLTPDHLPKLARRIRHDMQRLEMIRNFRDDELDRIRECCNHRIKALEAQLTYCTRILAKPLVPDLGIEFPGLGKFKFRKGREFVDDEAYQNMTPEEQTRVQTQRPGCFTHKVTITPDKRTIKARLEDFKGGRSVADVDGFEIKCKPDDFRFEPEREMDY